jgi:hypothetical protein
MTHPITPPPELVQQWRQQVPAYRDGVLGRENWLMFRAAQWGADQELEACCEWLEKEREHLGWAYRLNPQTIRAARRPKPPSLKEQALAVLTQYMTGKTILTKDSVDTIRRALEALPE